MTTWKELSTLEKVAEVRNAHPQTAGSARTMAAFLSEKFGEVISRNAVIGLYNRRPGLLNDMPLSNVGNVAGNHRTPKTKAPQSVKPLVGPAHFARKKVDPAKAAAVKVIENRPPPPNIPAPFLVRLFELQNNDCRWPVSGEKADTLFCGHNVEPGKPYCCGHARLSVGAGTRSEQLAVRRVA